MEADLGCTRKTTQQRVGSLTVIGKECHYHLCAVQSQSYNRRWLTQSIIVGRLMLSVLAKISIVLLSGFDLHFGFTLCRFTHHLHCA